MRPATLGEKAGIKAILLVPFLFFAILFGWGRIEAAIEVRKVSRFILEHRALVTKRLSDPKVHSFSLAHSPDDPSRLHIRFDVDDKRTYLMLEDELMDDSFELKRMPLWATRLRSDEDLGNNYGFAAWGFRDLAEGMYMLLTAVIASVSLAGAYLFLALRRIRARPIGAKPEAKGLTGLEEFS